MKEMQDFVPLHVHSQYSILDATASVKGIVKKAKEFKMSSLALTDHGNLFGAVEFYKECKDAGIKPIIGCDFYEAPNSRLEKKADNRYKAAFSITLLAKNKAGYENLVKLSSLGYTEGFYYYPRIDFELLETHNEGLICLTGGLDSRFAQEFFSGGKESLALALKRYQTLFPEDFYLEIQRHAMTEDLLVKEGMKEEAWLLQRYKDFEQKQTRYNEALVSLSQELKIPLAATNASHYLERDDWKAHEILLNVQSGEPCEILEKDAFGNPKFRTPNPKRKVYPSHEYYFKSKEEMNLLFKDLPQALSETLKIADKCHVEIDFKAKHYPVFVPPSLTEKKYGHEERKAEVEKFLWDLCQKGIEERYNSERLEAVAKVYPGQDPLEVVKKRLEMEMSIIAPKGMCDYLLIVWDFINWAKRNGIPVGPGRGSGAGSIVLYLIGVTDIEPLRFHLFFERFINPERISYPDIDVDICMERRGEVIQYTLEKYGKENVAQIITFGTMKAKMVIKDVGRVLSVPLPKVNEIAKLIPDDLNITLDGALEKDPDLKKLYEVDEEAKRIIDIGKRLEGSIRNTGIHAAGIIVSHEPLTEHIPICLSKDSDMPVTQYSMKPVEQVGMLKIDFLGLKTLTAIQYCVEAIQQNQNVLIDWVNLPLDNKATFDLLNQGKTLGIFQLESGGMQDLSRQLHLDRFEEIIAVGALYRPGPMDMIPSFINRKHGKEPIEYDHDWMRTILDETYGIMVYQEQVMQIASALAKYSLGEGDVLRRAMGKKDHAEMAKQREKFRQGALENGISEEIATRIFDKMEKFASYGFNKSHAAAYGYLSYATAFFKANYPREWMASLLTCDSADITKVAKFIGECEAMNIQMLPPDVNEADSRFTATPQGIRFAMSGIKGIGTGVVEAILTERRNKGPFTSLYQFIKRVDKKTVGKKAIENLVDAGCFDFTKWGRDELKEKIEEMYESALKEEKDVKHGVMTFFSLLGESDEKRFLTPPKITRRTSTLDRLFKEKELLGFFLTGHPMDDYREILKRLSCVPFESLKSLNHDSIVRTAFLIEDLDVKIASKTQKKFAILKAGDGREHLEIPVWADLYEEKQSHLKVNALIYAVIHVEQQPAFRLSIKWLDDLMKADEAMILSCDEAFDRAKHQVERFAKLRALDKSESKKESASSTKNDSPQKNKAKPGPSMSSKLKFNLLLDVDKIRFSEILKLKELIREAPIGVLSRIDFLKNKQVMAHLHLHGNVFESRMTEFEERVKELFPDCQFVAEKC